MSLPSVAVCRVAIFVLPAVLWRIAFLLFAGCLVSFAADVSPFYLPIRNNDVAALKELLRARGPKARDARGNSPLMYAAALGTPDVLRLLLDAGADPNAANELGATPLMWCAGDAAKVKLLLAKGAKVNVRSKLGRTPLLIAAAYDGAVESARLMIVKGADVNARDESGVTVLNQAANVNNLEVARMLLAKGANVNIADNGGFTPLHGAATNAYRGGALVKLLLEHGAAVNAKSDDTAEVGFNGPIAIGHITPLMDAAQMGGYESVEALLKAGADPNAMDVRDANALVFAVAVDHPNPKVVQLLLAKSSDKDMAREWAWRNQNPAILPLFGLKPTPSPAASAAESRTNPREAISRALAVSQPVAGKFLHNGGCSSCHSQYLNGMAVGAARSAGVKTEPALENADTRATQSLRGSLQEAFFQAQEPGDSSEAVGFALLQLASAGVPQSLAIDSMVHHMAAMQRKEGDWQTFEGRPPIESGEFGQTARAIRALRSFPIPARKDEFEQRIQRAAAWVEKAEPLTTEDRTMQILGLVWAGHTAPAGRVKELVGKQRTDGGWGQTDYHQSDAFATGEALWALHESGMTSSDPVYRRGVDFILRTQQEDGTWHVVSRSFGFQPYFQSGFPYEQDQWISQAGTAMAVIGLSFAAK
jgi:N-acyl-D-amino-acid deacylase